jgi:hypothetical protein
LVDGLNSWVMLPVADKGWYGLWYIPEGAAPVLTFVVVPLVSEPKGYPPGAPMLPWVLRIEVDPSAEY